MSKRSEISALLGGTSAEFRAWMTDFMCIACDESIKDRKKEAAAFMETGIYPGYAQTTQRFKDTMYEIFCMAVDNLKEPSVTAMVRSVTSYGFSVEFSSIMYNIVATVTESNSPKLSPDDIDRVVALDHESIVRDLVKLIESLIADQPEILEFKNAYSLFSVEGFNCGDLKPSIYQVTLALSEIKGKYGRISDKKGVNMEFKRYNRKGYAEMRPYVKKEDLSRISVNKEDDPETDMGFVARNTDNHEDMWYVARAFAEKNYQIN